MLSCAELAWGARAALILSCCCAVLISCWSWS